MKLKLWVFMGITASLFFLNSTEAYAKQVQQKAYKPSNSLAEFVANDNVGDVYSEVVVNLKSNKVDVDGEKANLREILDVSSTKEDELLDSTAKKVVNYVEENSICDAKKISATKVVITNNF